MRFVIIIAIVLLTGVFVMGNMIESPRVLKLEKKVLSADTFETASDIGVVPALRYWRGRGGVVSLKDASFVVADADTQDLRSLAELLQEDIKACGFNIFPVLEKKPTDQRYILLKIGDIDQSLSPEAYQIDIGESVTISGNSYAGVYYGTRTLLQMLLQQKETLELPKGTIIDWPEYTHRILMLDVGRAPFPMPVLYDYLRMMSWYKMNELHLHLSDAPGKSETNSYSGFRVECETFPELTSKDCFYTKRQIRAFQDAAKRMGITVIPEFDMPGHARCFTKIWPEIAYREKISGKIKMDYLDINNPETVKRLKLLLDEMIPLFDAPDVHIGTDEYRIGGWPNGKEFLEMNDALMLFINEMNAHIRAKGKNCRIWYGTDHIKSRIQPDPTLILDIWNLDNKTLASLLPGNRFINSCEFASYIVPGATYYGVNNKLVYERWNPWNCGGSGSWDTDSPANLKIKNDPGLMGGKLHVWMDVGPNKVSNREIAKLTLPSLRVFAETLWGTKGSDTYQSFKERAANKLPVPMLSKTFR